MLTRSTTSLRLMLIDRLLPAMLGLLLVGALAANWVALRAATKAYDRGLLDTAFAIAEQLRVVDGKLQLPLSQQARAVLLGGQIDKHRTLRCAPQALPKIKPLVGTPVPAVASTFSTFATWFTAVPRTWRTISAIPFMPWI